MNTLSTLYLSDIMIKSLETQREKIENSKSEPETEKTEELPEELSDDDDVFIVDDGTISLLVRKERRNSGQRILCKIRKFCRRLTSTSSDDDANSLNSNDQVNFV